MTAREDAIGADRLVFEVYKDRIKVQLESLPLGRKR